MLKNYQTNALSALSNFLQATNLSELPIRCSIKIPTGGGKTRIAAHIGGIFNQFLEKPPVFILWLVPLGNIYSQTLNSLQNPDHPNYRALLENFGGNLQVLELQDLPRLTTHQMTGKTFVIVASFQAFNVSDKETRIVNRHHELMDCHFEHLPPNLSNFHTDKNGYVIPCISNLLAFHHPIILLDEAHKNQTSLANQTLLDLNPLAIVELTATPKSSTQIIYSASAKELWDEGMIKFPLDLMPHNDNEEFILEQSIGQRDQLETLTAAIGNTTAYIRPICLIACDDKNGQWNIDNTKEWLLARGIDELHIAIETGQTKELADVDLLNPLCQIRYILTVNALREGWDCSFAYVLCCLRHIRSNTDAEQFAGRVMRMPYATVQPCDALNRGYIYTMSNDFPATAEIFVEGLKNAGMERTEASRYIQLMPQSNQCLLPIDYTIPFPKELDDSIKQDVKNGANTLTFLKPLDRKQMRKVQTAVQHTLELKNESEATVMKIQEVFDNFTGKRIFQDSPFDLGENFASVPHLCYRQQILDNTSFDWELRWHKVSSHIKFSKENSSKWYTISLDGTSRVQYESAKLPKTFSLPEIDFNANDRLFSEIGNKVAKLLNSLRYTVQELSQYVERVLNGFLERGIYSQMEEMSQSKNAIARSISQHVLAYKKRRLHRVYWSNTKNFHAGTTPELQFSFDGSYKPSNEYGGTFRFQKHFYSKIHDLPYKTDNGTIREEYRCAQKLDDHPEVKYWVRNVDNIACGFFLRMPDQNYFPDFVCLMTDGTIWLVEYKGSHLEDASDAINKKKIGELWARLTGNRYSVLTRDDL